MTSRQQELLDSLEKATEGFIADFEASLPTATGDLLDFLFDFLGELKKRPGGNIEASVYNLKLIDRFRSGLDSYLKNSLYSKSVNSYIKGFASTTSFIDEYFTTLVTDFKDNEALFKAILESNIETTLDSLLGSGLQANFKAPIFKLLKQHVSGNSSLVSLRKALRQELSLNSLPVKYLKQQSSDALMQYTRNYMQTLSNDLGIEYYYYAGTKITDSREFCSERSGKYYTRKQVEAWADKDWSGKIKGTSSTTIFTYCGGYGCRHKLIPVSEAQYKRATQK